MQARKVGSAKHVPPKSQLHEWIASLCERESTNVAAAIQLRLTDTDSPELLLLAKRLAEFTPYSIEYSENNAYVFCSRLDAHGRLQNDVVENYYLSQPIDAAVLRKRVAFYDEKIRALLKSFWSKYAGAGEEMAGFAGQFLLEDAECKDYDLEAEERFGKWHAAHVLYNARNNDLVLINPQGATAWFVMETNEVVPLAATFPEFLKHYTAFLGSDVFDSWSSRKFLEKPQLRIHR
jgi:hypothetical protein